MSFLRRLTDIGFSYKVGGGFAAMMVLTGLVGAVGTLAILEFRQQSDVSERSIAVLDQLQQVSNLRESYLSNRQPEEADQVVQGLGTLKQRLSDLRQSVEAEGSTSEGVDAALGNVEAFEKEFQATVAVIGDQKKRTDILLTTGTKMEMQTVQISEQLAKIKREASSSAKKAASAQNRAEKMARFVTLIKDHAGDIEKMLNKVKSRDESAIWEKMQATAAELEKTAANAKRIKVDGLDKGLMVQILEQSKSLQTAVKATLQLPFPIEESLQMTGGIGTSVEIASLSDQVRDQVYGILDKARKVARASNSRLNIVEQVAVNSDKLLVQSLGTRALTMELLAGTGKVDDKAVLLRIDSFRNQAGILKADAAVFPEIQTNSENINALLETYDGEFRSMTEGAVQLGKRQEALTQLAQNVQNQINELAREQSRLALSTASTNQSLIGGAVLLALLVGAIFAVIITLAITRPTRALTNTMEALAGGKVDLDISGAERRDEIGDMSRAVQVFRDNAVERIKLEESSRVEQAEQSRRQQEIDNLIANFDGTVQGLLESVGQTAGAMESTAQSLNQIATNGAQQAGSTTEATDGATQNVKNVAGAAEELSASIGEIGVQVQRTEEIVRKASQSAQDSNDKVMGLASAAHKIGEVVSLIQAIAEQTNLLALNATIEAARAGEAGKGFAVVAAEVKELANQTSKATEEISSQIAAIQGSSDEAVDAIGAITQIMGEVDAYTAAIATAVTQQNGATAEITGNVQSAAEGTYAVRTNMEELSGTVEHTKESSQEVLSASEELAQKTTLLKEEISSFLGRVSAA